VGFGIKDAESAKAIAANAAGVVVGSALVSCIARAIADGGGQQAAIDAAGNLVAEIREGIDSITS
jgi:tryptophan synthase alpha chain